MKKRILSVLLVMTCMTALFSGCNKKKSDVDYQKQKVLRVGMECAYAPFNWTQETSKVANGDTAPQIYNSEYYAYGYDVMVAKKLADELGWDLEIHKVEWTSIGLALDAKEYDCIIAGMGYTEEREKSYDFTTPYYYRDTCCTVKKGGAFDKITGLSQFKGKSAKATCQLSTIFEDFINEIPDATAVAKYETTSEAFMAVSSGTADVSVCDVPTAKSAVMNNSDLVVLNFADDDTFANGTSEVCIAVREGDAELQKLLQDAMDKIGWTKENKADMDSLMDEAIKLQPSAN